MKQPTQSLLLSIINCLNWNGHVELGDNDRLWLAGEIAVALSPGDEAVCEVCSLTKPIVIRTPLGMICEDCIENMYDEAEEIRETLEEN